MAKNIFQTKKRVSHFQKTPKDINGENESLGCKDYVASIIQDMDYVHSGYTKIGVECKEKYSTNSEVSLLDIPVMHLSSPSKSKESPQTFGKHAKPKQLFSSRKFPLMEKSQKILKQLKHNQNIPKPRAHVAGIPKSPAKSQTKSISKKKKTSKFKNKVSSNSHSKLPSNHSTILNKNKVNINSHSIVPSNHSTILYKNSNSSKLKDDHAVNYCKSKKIENHTSGKSSLRSTPTNNDINAEVNSVLEFDSSTSDSEYEKFLKKSKKGLKKKSSKRQKQNSVKSKLRTKRLKRKKSECNSELHAYVYDNETELPKSSKISPFKKQKHLQPVTDLNNDLICSDHDDLPGISTRDSSSGTDDDSLSTAMTQQVIQKPCEVKHISETTVLSISNSWQSYQNTSVLDSNENDLSNSKGNVQIENSIQHTENQNGSVEITSCENSNQSDQNLHVLESRSNSDNVPSKTLIASIIKKEQDNVPLNMVIDLCNSDDECNISGLNSENVFTPLENSIKNSADSDSEESDIEVIEVKKIVQNEDKSTVSMLSNDNNSLNNEISDKQQLENTHANYKSVIKTENFGNKYLENAKSKIKAEKIDDKHDVVYQTDICVTKTVFDKRSVIGYCSETQNVPSKESFEVSSKLSVVKQEISIDDDIIILDSVCSAKGIDVSTLSSAKSEIKSEPSRESKIKLSDHVNSKPLVEKISEGGEKIQDVVPVSSTELFKLYKMECETFLEMKKANANVEASLMNLQARQKEKMLYVRNLFLKCVQGNEDTKVQQAENPNDSKNFTSANGQNNCDITLNNSFSPNLQIATSSTALQDVKPDVSKLRDGMQPVDVKPKIESYQDNLNSTKCTPKLESDDKQTLKLLNEKCSECGKVAIAACQRCAKVFFCSHECGKKFWINGHVKVCGTK